MHQNLVLDYCKKPSFWLVYPILLFFINVHLKAQVVVPGNVYSSATHLCSFSSNQLFWADSSVNPQFAQSGPNYGCLGSGNAHNLKRPHWFTFQVTSGGTLNFAIQPTLNNDLDYALFGPFANLPSSANALGSPIQCSNSTVFVDTLNVNVSANQYYVLLVTNPEGRNGAFSFVPTPNVNTAIIGNTLTFNPSLPSSVLVCSAPFLVETFPSTSNIRNLVFLGSGVDSVTGLFNPSIAGVGSHTILVFGNPFGCTSTLSATYQINVTALPSITRVTVTPNNLAGSAGSVSLNAQVSPPGSYTFLWSGPAGVAVPPFSSSNLQTSTPGWYTVRAIPDPMTNPACSESIDSVFVYQGPNIALNGNDTVCWQTNSLISGSIITSLPVGISVTSYQWQRKPFGSAIWSNINGQVTPGSLSAIGASGRQNIRLSVELSNGFLVFSNEVEITVLNQGVAPVLSLDTNYSQNSTICINDAVGLIATPASGGAGAFLYRWQKLVGGNWVDLFVPGMILDRQFANLTQTTSYRILAEDVSGVGCAPLISNIIEIIVHGLVTPGSVTASDTSLCFGQNVVIRNSQSGTVVLGGQLQYVWEESFDRSTWTVIPGQNNESLVTPSYTSGQRRFYRRRVYSSLNNVLCPVNLPAVSNVISVIWLQDYPFLSMASSFGFTGPFVHSIWQAAPSNASSQFTNSSFTLSASAAANSQTSAQYALPSGNVQEDGIFVFDYNPGSSTNLTAVSHSFLVGTGVVNLGPGGNFFVKVLKDQAVAFRIAFNNPNAQARQLQGSISNFKFYPNRKGITDTICPGASFVINGAIVSQSSTPANWAWTKVLGAGNLTGSLNGSTGNVGSVLYQSSVADAGTTVLLKLQATRTSSACQGYADSIIVPIYVKPLLVPASFDSSQNRTICYNSAPGVLSAAVAGGGSGSYSYKWEFRNQGSLIWINIPGATSLQLTDTTSKVTSSREYRILTTDLGNPSCGQSVASPNSLNISVLNSLTPPVIQSGATDHLYLCPDLSAISLQASPASGGSNNFTYTWEYVDSSTTVGSGIITDSIVSLWPWQTLSGVNGLVASTPAMLSGSTRYYRVVAIANALGNLPGCGRVYSQFHKVSVLDAVPPVILTQPSVMVYADSNGNAPFDCSRVSTVNNGSLDNCSGQVSGFVIRKLSDGPALNKLPNCPPSINSPLNGNYFSTALQVSLPYNANWNTTSSDFSSTYLGPNAQPSPDLFLRFNSGTFDSIAISSCNSGFNTFLHLLDGCGNHIVSNDDNGALCSGTSGSIYKRIHPNSDYVLVVEGNGLATGIANISINGLEYCPVFSCQKPSDTAILYGFDASGNRGFANVLVNVVDTVGPVMVTRFNNVFLDQNGQATAVASAFNNGSFDNCSSSNAITFQIDPQNYSCSNLGSNSAVLTGIDLSGNSSRSNVVVNVFDTIKPSANAYHLQVVYLDSMGMGLLNPGIVDSLSNDNCSIDTLYSVPLQGWSSFGSGLTGCNNCANTFMYDCLDVDTLFPAGLVVIDQSNNIDTAFFSVLVQDTLAPHVLSYPAKTVYLKSAEDCQELYYWQEGLSFADNCGGAVQLSNQAINGISVSNYPFLLLPKGIHYLTFTLTDSRGNDRDFRYEFQILDSIPPVLLNFPNDIQVSSDSGSCGKIVTWVEPTGSDNCAGYILNSNFSPGQFFSLGVHTVIYSITDASGNVLLDSFNVTVQDQRPPLVSPLYPTVYLGANGSVTVPLNSIFEAYDHCSGVNFLLNGVIVNDLTFSCSNIGNNNVTLTIRDAFGNSIIRSSQITVFDSTRPVIFSVDSVNLVLGSNGLVTLNLNQVDLGSTDNCSIVGRFLSKTSFNCSDLGINSVEFRVIDAAGNISFKWINVRILDNTAPAVSLIPGIQVYLNAQGSASLNTSSIVQVSDNCRVDSILPNILNFSCSDVSNPNATVTRLVRIKDQSGNTSTVNASITVLDTIRPLVVPTNYTAYFGSNGSVSVSANNLVSFSDNCCIGSVVPATVNFTCLSNYSNNVQITVSDCKGNSRTVVSQVTLFDTIKPILLFNDTVRLSIASNGLALLNLSQVDLGSFDNCNIVSRTLSKTVFNCADIGLNQVEFRVIDQFGNMSFVWIKVLVNDLTPPTAASTPNLTIYLNNAGMGTLQASSMVQASDNCSIDSILPLVHTFTCADVSNPPAPVARQVTVKDKAGNSTLVNALVTVRDTMRPIAIPLNRTVYLNAQGTASLNTSTLVNANDNCCISTFTPSVVTFNCANVGSSANNVQFNVSDCHGNSQTVSVQVVVIDTVAPVVTAQPRNVYLNAQCQAVVSSAQIVTASDVCGIASYDPIYFTFGRGDCGLRDTVTISVRDVHQNVKTITVPLLVLDTIKPVIISSPTVSDTVAYCDSRVVYTPPVGTDNCGLVQTLQISGLPSGSIFPVGLTINRFNLIDQCNNITEFACSVYVKSFVLPYSPINYTFCTLDSSVLLSGGFNGFRFTGPGVFANRFYPSLAPAGVIPISWVYTNSDGCDSSGVISVDLIAAPSIPEIVTLSPTLLRVSQPYFGYQWYRYGSPIGGATSREYNLFQSGVYAVEVMSIGGCYRMSPPVGIGVGVGVDEITEGDGLFYPNPSDGIFNLRLSSELSHDPILEVFDALGRSVYRRDLQSLHRIDLSDLAKGKYLAVIRSGELSHQQTLIIK